MTKREAEEILGGKIEDFYLRRTEYNSNELVIVCKKDKGVLIIEDDEEALQLEAFLLQSGFTVKNVPIWEVLLKGILNFFRFVWNIFRARSRPN